eukprot:CAMPEP_0183455730 /NCGR_PEP_ID=MMETSP0370-20130417/127319_1 /TAXON_ID=268820 /ORGANISM="Peridinium aciculiferum, Strain PAER-2" /LENGTH=42 /DNA_ID= /DNA_START= /DNA_END= /DNA_ORIENTATION=
MTKSMSLGWTPLSSTSPSFFEGAAPGGRPPSGGPPGGGGWSA